MPTQLNYSFITQPNPGYLIAGQPAELAFLVSNPGEPVTLSSLGFTFPYGSAGSDLCASVSDVSATTLPGDGWTAGTDKSGNFVLTPPGGSVSVDTSGFAFTLTIQANSEVGVVNLDNSEPVQSFTIEEKTDKGTASWSPLVPLSKFPAEFQFSDLKATPPIANQGESIVLSWTGTAGATYTIDWPNDEHITYSGGSPPIIKQKDTSFPPSGSDNTLSIGPSQVAVFLVTAEYSSSGKTLFAGPLEVVVAVNLDAPTISEFTATWQDSVLELSWKTKNAKSVTFDFLSSVFEGNGLYPFSPSPEQPVPTTITLTAHNAGPDAASQTLVQMFEQVGGSPVTTGYTPQFVTVSPDGSRVYVVNSDATLSVFDAVTLEPVSGSGVTIGGGPLALSSDGQRLYVINYDPYDTLALFDATTLQPIGSPIAIGSSPISVAAFPAGNRVFVANYYSNLLTVFNTETLQVIAASSIVGCLRPQFVAVSPDGTRIYVADFAGGALIALEAGTLQPIGGSPVTVGNAPGCIAVSPDSKRVFVTSYGDNKLVVLNAETLQPVSGSPISVQTPNSVAVSPDGAFLYVTSRWDNNLSILDAVTLQPVSGSPVSVGVLPTWVAVSKATNPPRTFVTSGMNDLCVVSRVFVPANGG